MTERKKIINEIYQVIFPELKNINFQLKEPSK